MVLKRAEPGPSDEEREERKRRGDEIFRGWVIRVTAAEHKMARAEEEWTRQVEERRKAVDLMVQARGVAETAQALGYTESVGGVMKVTKAMRARVYRILNGDRKW